MNLELTNKIKKSIFYQLEPIQEDVGLLLSSGVDSRVLLFSLLLDLMVFIVRIL